MGNPSAPNSLTKDWHIDGLASNSRGAARRRDDGTILVYEFET